MIDIEKHINKIIQGNALEVLRNFPSESIDCIITSPPYYNLRDYNTDPVNWADGWSGELGQEPSVDLYVAHLCDIFDECHRVLKKTGTVWVVIGDSYSSGATMSMAERIDKELGREDTKMSKMPKRSKPNTTLPPKCLIGVPFHFALEMINRGWILRNTIIWRKPNAMPSSCKNRFTIDFEYVFFFVKSQKYFFNQILEPFSQSYIITCKSVRNPEKTRKYRSLSSESINKTFEKVLSGELVGRNKRAVWDVSTENLSEAHFAPFPQKLIEPMIKAGCPKAICSKCGAIFTQQTIRKSFGENREKGKYDIKRMGDSVYTIETVANCDCNAPTVPGIVLDIFAGSGTTLRVAKRLARKSIGIELNPQYVQIAKTLNSSFKKKLASSVSKDNYHQLDQFLEGDNNRN